MVSSASYEQLVKDAQGWDHDLAHEIDRDVHRTTIIGEESWTALRRMLLAYALKNRDIRYCQGMHILGALLLKYMKEETAFWSLAVLLECLLPDYHVSSMIGLHMDCAVLQKLLGEMNPALLEHLVALGINMQVICTKVNSSYSVMQVFIFKYSGVDISPDIQILFKIFFKYSDIHQIVIFFRYKFRCSNIHQTKCCNQRNMNYRLHLV